MFIVVPPGVPEISGYSEGQTLTAGERLSLKCLAKNGNPPIELHWYKGNQKVDLSFVNQPEVNFA